MLKYFRIKNRHHSKSQDAEVPGATTKSGEPLTPLLAPQDENFLAKVINDMEPEDIILPGSPPASPQPTVLVSPTEVASTLPTPQVVTGSDGRWKEGLKTKWGYLESLGSVSVTRLGEAITMVTDKGKGKDKAVDPEADGGEVRSNISMTEVGKELMVPIVYGSYIYGNEHSWNSNTSHCSSP